jgi:hypothetical protein
MTRNASTRLGSVLGFVRCFSLAATATLMLAAMPDHAASAMSLMTPQALPSAQHDANGLVTEVHGGGHGGGGHGGGFHGGGFHGGGFHSGGFHSGGFHGGGFHHGGFHGGGFHHGGFGFAHHRHFYGGYYPYYSGYSYPYYHRCRTIWTSYGPRRVCGYRHWHRWHRWHHRHWRHY